VDYKEKKNFLRTKTILQKDNYVLISGPNSDNIQDISPKDADTLQPVDLDAETVKQFWITAMSRMMPFLAFTKAK